jgi:perosamine synthetase
MIPISRPYIGKEEIKAVSDVIMSGMISQGPKVKELEEKFASSCGTKYSVAVNSGTAALHSALYSAGIGKDDEVITTPFTFIATANVILMQQAKPVFVDIDETTFNINPNKIASKITSKTKAVIPVDIYGKLCDYDSIQKIANQNKLFVLEDACQAIGSIKDGNKAGSYGDAAAFSFYGTKNLACGEGGMITTDSKELADKAMRFRQHGRSDMDSYEYSGSGYNYRTTDICAAILLEQLKKLKFITDKRRENAVYLTKGLKDIDGITLPKISYGSEHVFHQFTIRVQDSFPLTRDETAMQLKAKGIGTSVFYPKPLHLLERFQKFGYKAGDFPIAEKACNEVLSLPVHPNLQKAQLDTIINGIKGLV